MEDLTPTTTVILTGEWLYEIFVLLSLVGAASACGSSLGMNTDGNGRTNLSLIFVSIFFLQKRDQIRKSLD
jgi:hypothetical protein